MKISLILSVITLSLIVSFSCCSQIQTPLGVYRTHTPSKFELFKYRLLGYDGYSGGLELNLKIDSTFTYKTCGHIVKGAWSLKDQTIIMDVDSVENRISESESIITSLDSVLIYNENIIYDYHKSYLINRNYNSINKLFKVE